MSDHLLKLGTRGSKLALWQAQWVKGLLEKSHPGLGVEIVIIVSSGDQDRTRPLEQLGGEGLFTRELEQWLERGEVDLAVHSLKDLPTSLPEGFSLAAVPPRGAVEDALVTRDGGGLDSLAPGAAVATGSPRRKAQLLYLRPDLDVVGIRGNVPTRLQKLEDEGLDGTILARAGLERLGFGDRICQVFPVDLFSPAVGQGAVGVEVRVGNTETAALIRAIDHAPTHAAVDAERGFLSGLGGGCQLPVGAHAYVDGSAGTAFLNLAGRVINRQGTEHLRADMTGPLDRAWELGERLADLLIGQGARALLTD
jgi:hydroxymethylbilane synthase